MTITTKQAFTRLMERSSLENKCKTQWIKTKRWEPLSTLGQERNKIATTTSTTTSVTLWKVQIQMQKLLGQIALLPTIKLQRKSSKDGKLKLEVDLITSSSTTKDLISLRRRRMLGMIICRRKRKMSGLRIKMFLLNLLLKNPMKKSNSLKKDFQTGTRGTSSSLFRCAKLTVEPISTYLMSFSW